MHDVCLQHSLPDPRKESHHDGFSAFFGSGHAFAGSEQRGTATTIKKTNSIFLRSLKRPRGCCSPHCSINQLLIDHQSVVSTTNISTIIILPDRKRHISSTTIMRCPQYIRSLRVTNGTNEEITLEVTHTNRINDEGDKVSKMTISPNREHWFAEHTVQMDTAYFVCPISVAKVTVKGHVQLADLTVDTIVSEFQLKVTEKDGKINLVGEAKKE